jgi:2-dehydropantoate 2-reductase
VRGGPVTILGAGAVGSYFGGMLARGGVPVTLVGRRAHVEAVRRDGLIIERASGIERIEVDATDEIRAVAGALLVLICVKTPDTEEIARAAAGQLSHEALVVSFQNGVDNVERIHRATGIEAAAAAVYVAADLVAPGRVRHSGRGDLIVGTFPQLPLAPREGRPALADVAMQFERCGVPCRVVEDIRSELWVKMAMNCAYNALSALGQVQYGDLVADPAAHAIMRHVIREAFAVARTSGVPLAEGDVERAVFDLARAMPAATSSTAQDLARGRRTEIDALNGFLAREGERLGIPVPYNRMLHSLVKLLERPRGEKGG